MGRFNKAKTGGAKVAKAALASPAAPVETPPKDWLETLTAEEQEAERKKREAREKKAAEAKRNEERDRSKREQWEKVQKSAALRAAREEKKLDREFQQDLAQATRDGVLTAAQHVDGAYYVELAKDTWKVTEYTYYCPHCDAHLSENTLGSHLAGGNHRRKMAMQVAPDVADAGSRAAAPLPPAPAPLLPAPRSSAALERWQEFLGDRVRCIPCGKYCDGTHETSDDHRRRLARWLSQATAEYREPRQPWLAWVTDPMWPGEITLKCLLCDKWVQDLDTPEDPDCVEAYCGAHGDQGPKNQKDHARRIQNLQAHLPKLRAERARWHPPAAQAAAPAARPRAEDGDGKEETLPRQGIAQPAAAEGLRPPEPPVPKGRPCALGAPSHMEAGEATWNPPPSPAAAATASPVWIPASAVEYDEC